MIAEGKIGTQLQRRRALSSKDCEVLSGRRPSVMQRPFVKPAVYFAND
jgi:hypothetical protein